MKRNKNPFINENLFSFMKGLDIKFLIGLILLLLLFGLIGKF